MANATLTISVTIRDALGISLANLPDGVVGQSYSVQCVAEGGFPPYVWSAIGLPAGITMTPAGLLSGTPTVAGTGSITLSVTDSGA